MILPRFRLTVHKSLRIFATNRTTTKPGCYYILKQPDMWLLKYTIIAAEDYLEDRYCIEQLLSYNSGPCFLQSSPLHKIKVSRIRFLCCDSGGGGTKGVGRIVPVSMAFRVYLYLIAPGETAGLPLCFLHLSFIHTGGFRIEFRRPTRHHHSHSSS
jgi:hypothetical protein